MTTYGPRSAHRATPASEMAGGGMTIGTGDVVDGPSRFGGGGGAHVPSTDGVLGRATSQQSVSSGINSFGPLHEEKTSLVIPLVSLSSNSVPEKSSVVVSHIDPDGTLYLQSIKWAPALNDLMAKLNAEMSKTESRDKALLGKENSLGKGRYCVAKSVNDSLWYRALVVEPIKTGIIVKFIDFGNDEILRIKRDVQPLKPYFAKLPAQAVPASLHGLKTALPDGVGETILVQLMDQFTDTHLICQAVKRKDANNERLMVELYTVKNGKPAHSVLDILQERARSGSSCSTLRSISSTSINVKEGKVFCLLPFTQIKLEIKKKYRVVLVYCTSPGEFWCQLEGDNVRLEQLMDYMQMMVRNNELRPLSTWPPNLLETVSAQFPDDEHWYRGVVLGVEGNKAKVLFVDYGNVTLLPEERCAQMPPGLINIDAMAFPCCLDMIKPLQGSRWGAEATQVIDTLTQQKGIVATVVDLNASNQYVLDLVQSQSASKERNIALELIDAKMVRPTSRIRDFETSAALRQANPLESEVAVTEPAAFSEDAQAAAPEISAERIRNEDGTNVPMGEAFLRPPDMAGSLKEVILSWVINPNEFYVHLADTRSLVETLGRNINQIYSNLRPDERILPSVDAQSCVTRFLEDGHWYRAEIIKVSTGKYLNPLDTSVDVRFVDFGNPDTVMRSQLKTVHIDLMQQPIFALRCSLRGVRCISANGDSVAAGFQTFLDQVCGANKMRCHFVSRSVDPDGEYRYEVELNLGGRNIAQMVIEAGYGVPDLSVAASLDSFETIDDMLVPSVVHPSVPSVKSPSVKSPSSAIPIIKPNGEPVLVQKSTFEGSTALPQQQRLEQQVSAALPPAVQAEVAQLRPFKGFAGEKHGEVSNFKSLDSFHVQLSDSGGSLVYLQAVLKTRFAKNKEEVKDPKVGQVVVALWTADGVWYRARILAVNTATVDVLFVDYGNSDAVPVANIRPLRADSCLTQPPLAIECRLWKNTPGKWREISDDEGNSFFSQPLTIRMKRDDAAAANMPYDVLVSVGDQDLTSYFTSLGKSFTAPKTLQSPPQPQTLLSQALNPQPQQIDASFNSDSSWLESSRLNASAQPFAPKPENDSPISESGFRANLGKGNDANESVSEAPMSEGMAIQEPRMITNVTGVEKAGTEAFLTSPIGVVSSAVAKSSSATLVDSLPATPVLPPTKFSDRVETSEDAKPTHDLVANPLDDVASVASSSAVASKQTGKKYPEDEDFSGRTETVILCWIDDPRQLFFLLSSRVDEIQGIEQDLHQIYTPLGKSQKRLAAFDPGTICVAKFSEDGNWYRSVIHSSTFVEGVERFLVFFVDYGNCDTVSKDDLKSIHPRVLKAVPAVIKGEFRNLVPPNGCSDWSSTLQSFLTESAEDSDLVCQFGDKKVDECGREVYSIEKLTTTGGIDLEKLLIDKGFAARIGEAATTPNAVVKPSSIADSRACQPTSDIHGISPLPPTPAPTPQKESASVEIQTTLPLHGTPPPPVAASVQLLPRAEIPGEVISAMMAHVDSVDSFFIHSKDHEADLNQLVDQLYEFYSSDEGQKLTISSVSVGDLVCALWTDDNWYRSLVIDILPGQKYRLQFIDYGNQDDIDVKCMRQLTGRWKSQSAKTYHCRLQKPEHASWLPDATSTIKAKILDTEAVFNVKFLSASPASLLHEVVLPVEIEFEGESFNLSVAKIGSSSPKKLMAGHLEVPSGNEKPTSPNASTIYSAQDSASFSEKENQPSFNQEPGGTSNSKDGMTTETSAKSDSSLPSLKKMSSTSSSRPISPFPTASIPQPTMSSDENNNSAKIDGVDVIVDPPRTFADGGVSRASSRPPSRPASRRGSVTTSLGGSPERQGRTDSRPRTPSQLKRSARTGSLVDIANQITAISQANQAAAAILKPPFIPGVIPQEPVRVIFAQQEGLERVWLQDEGVEEESLNLQSKLNDIYSSSSSPGTLPLPIVVGDFCVSKFVEDDQFYRAVVEEIKGDAVRIRYIDWGNVEEVSVSQLLSITPDLASTPALIFGPISLLNSTSPAQDAASKLKNFIEKEPETVLLFQLESNSGKTTAKLTTVDGNKDFLKEYGLVVGGQTKASDPSALRRKAFNTFKIAQGSVKGAYLSTAASPTTFYIQFTGCEEDLDPVMEEIANKINSALPLKNPEEGMPCLAKYSADGAWYRSEIKSVSPDGRLNVIFVDYGNSELVNNDFDSVRDIADAFLILPAQTVLCRSAGITGKDGAWSNQAKKDFESLLLDTEVFIEFVSSASSTRRTTAFALVYDVYLGDAKGNINVSKRFFDKGHAVKLPNSKL